jgi:hypothetical protein
VTAAVRVPATGELDETLTVTAAGKTEFLGSFVKLVARPQKARARLALTSQGRTLISSVEEPVVLTLTVSFRPLGGASLSRRARFALPRR